MELNEVPQEKLSTEFTFNVFDGPSGKQMNEKALTLSDAQKLASQLQESDPGHSLVIRSNRAIIQE